MNRNFVLIGALLAFSMACGCGSDDSTASNDGGTTDAAITPDTSAPFESGVDTSVSDRSAADRSASDGSIADGSASDSATDAAGGDAANATDSGNDSADAGTAPVCMMGTASAVCPVCAAPQVCCAQRCSVGTTGVFTSCGDTTCGGMGGALQCLGPQDCNGGICCGSGANTAPLDTVCVAGTTCPSNRQLIVCRTVADCPAPVNFRCSSGTSTAGIYSTCRSAPPVDAGNQDGAAEGGSLTDGGDDSAPPSEGGDDGVGDGSSLSEGEDDGGHGDAGAAGDATAD